MKDYSGYVGYIKLEGASIQNGVMSARQSADALYGIDALVKHLIVQRDPSLTNVEIEIPVKVREGSWEALIPTTIGQWLIAGGGVFVTTAAVQVANNTFKDKDVAALARDCMRLIKGIIKISKHIGRAGDKNAANGIKFKNDNKEVEIPNDDGIYLRTTREELEAYLNTPKLMLENIVNILDKDKELSIGEVDVNGVPHEEKITYEERKIFVSEPDENNDDATLFPELKHGDYVELIGIATRGNQLTNTIGFKYKEHILTCTPYGAPITSFKAGLFKKCLMKGTVYRSTDPMIKVDSPKIKFTELTPINDDDGQIKLV